jgi:hypothetical protein
MSAIGKWGKESTGSISEHFSFTPPLQRGVVDLPGDCKPFKRFQFLFGLPGHRAKATV